MIAVDTNLLVYAHRPECALHRPAAACIRELAEGLGPWAIPIHCLVEFAAVVTSRRLWRVPSSAAQVGEQVEAWRESPTLRLLGEDPSFWAVFMEAVAAASAAGGAVHDARIAACCRFHGVRELWTADRDFGRYPWLPSRNPLAG